MIAMPRPLTVILLFFIVLILESCCRSQLHFSGKVATKGGDAIPGAIVKVGEREVETDKDGTFKICVTPADRYVLNVSKLALGSVSKVYTDTASRVLITMAKATVVTADPNSDVIVEDTNPDISHPGGASPQTGLTPLDTLPFVFDAKGQLVSFTMPPSLKNTMEGVAGFQLPRRGAQISIPARSLVIEGSQRLPEDSIQVSVNTIDLYSPDGMPGDNTVDLGKGQRGAMLSYGAANIEAFYNGKPLQLGEGKTATLSIPVDTLSILSKADIPDEIPFLIYNNTSGLWVQDGSAKLNAERTAYTRQVSHFSTFNMDMVWSGQSCIQLCDGISAPAVSTSNALDITVPGKTKRMLLPGAVPCGAGTTDCGVYGIDGPNTHAIINLDNNIPVTVQVYKNVSGTTTATLEGTYVFNSGPAPAGSASTYQSCLYNDCAGPFRVSDGAACYEKTTPARDGSMLFPIMTFALAGTNVNMSLVFIETITGGTVNNTPLFYQVEFQTYAPADAFDPNKAWTKVDFDPALAQTYTHPALGGAGTTEWHMTLPVAFSGGLTNPTLNPTDIILFRASHSTTGADGTFTPEFVRAINMPMPGTTFSNDFNAAYPCNIVSH